MEFIAQVKELGRIRTLAETGRFADVATFVKELGEARAAESPGMCLFYGMALARLGEHEAGREWVEKALGMAVARGDGLVEVRAQNVLGAIAFEGGRIDEALDRFTMGLDAAHREKDQGTVGRCSNNLANIAYMRGDYGRAIGAYTMALAAFQHAGSAQGVAEGWHNIAAIHRDAGDYQLAREASDRAVEAATESGDLALTGQTIAGRAEIRILAGETKVGLIEAERAIAIHDEIGDSVRVTEDRRIRALALDAIYTEGQSTGENVALAEQAVDELREVMTLADDHGRPYLRGLAGRDLAKILGLRGDIEGARAAAHASRVVFEALGAEAEVGVLDLLLTELY